MVKNLSDATEDYLKAIYELSALHGLATTNHLAERLQVRPASVTGMIQRLASAQPPLVAYHKHRGVALTPDGQRAALEVIRHHRLLELWLQRSLGYSWDEVHAEADRMEHAISKDFVERIAEAMGNPQRDPHGEPIPSRDLSLPPQSTILLASLRPGQRAVVERVEAQDLKLLRYLEGKGLVPASRLEVLSFSEFDGNLGIQVEGEPEPVVLGPQVTGQVYIRVLP